MMRLTAYTSGSLLLAAGVIIKAINERANFFSACIYLYQSNACVIVLINLLVLLIGTVVFGLQRLLYGQLRPIEAEQLYDKAWFAVTETCLAMTIFRDEIGVWFIVLFISLLVGKVWAWIGEGRVEILDQQPPANPRLFHARLSASLILSLVFNISLLNYSINTVRRQAKPNMMVMFAFEFAVLTTGSISTALRYSISLREAAIIKRRLAEKVAEIRQQRQDEREQNQDGNSENAIDDDIDESQIDLPEWEEKSRWILYLELVTDLVRLILYLIFFVVLCVFYGMPLHIIRDVAIALRSFHKRLTDFIKYRHATRDMDQRYADATSEDIGNNDVCIICRETMQLTVDNSNPSSQRSRPKKLPCGHVLHFSCLRRWLQWQQNCPTCRQPVLREASSNQPGTPGGPQVPRRDNIQPVQAARGVREPEQPPENNNRQINVDQNAQLRAGNNQNGQGIENRPDNRWRRFQFGPLTLDVGAWQGPREFPPAPLQNPVVAGLPHQQGQQIPTSATTVNSEAANYTVLRSQIDSFEQQMTIQIRSLRSAVDHMAVVNASRAQTNFVEAAQSENQGSLQIFQSDSTTQPLNANSIDLPNGLVLPEGWTLVPLNPANQSGGSQDNLAGSSNPEIFRDQSRPDRMNDSGESARADDVAQQSNSQGPLAAGEVTHGNNDHQTNNNTPSDNAETGITIATENSASSVFSSATDSSGGASAAQNNSSRLAGQNSGSSFDAPSWGFDDGRSEDGAD